MPSSVPFNTATAGPDPRRANSIPGRQRSRSHRHPERERHAWLTRLSGRSSKPGWIGLAGGRRRSDPPLRYRQGSCSTNGTRHSDPGNITEAMLLTTCLVSAGCNRRIFPAIPLRKIRPTAWCQPLVACPARPTRRTGAIIRRPAPHSSQAKRMRKNSSDAQHRVCHQGVGRLPHRAPDRACSGRAGPGDQPALWVVLRLAGADTRQEAAMTFREWARSRTYKEGLGTDPTAGAALNKLFLKFSADAVRIYGCSRARIGYRAFC